MRHELTTNTNPATITTIPGTYVSQPGQQRSRHFQIPLKQLEGLLKFNEVTSLHSPLLGTRNRLVKRFIDISLSLFGLVFILSWLVPLLGLLIKLDSKGPVFFLQKRNKRGGGQFTCIKFRSMIVNDEAHVLPAAENDRRITRLGKFLRNHYLDELPQFLNVLWGDMSIVGPRPHMLSDNRRFEEIFENYHHRHQVKPGITGLAQVLGYVGSAAGTDAVKERIRYDILYIHHWTPSMDAKILFRSLRAILRF